MRVGIVGVAHHHVDAYHSALLGHDDVEVVGVVDHDPARLGEWAERHQVAALSGLDALLAAGIELAILCSETSHHSRLALRLLSSSVDVLCEKPLATDIDDAAAMVAEAQRRRVMLATAFPMRHSPAVIEARAAIVDGAIGPVLAISGVNAGQVPEAHGSWFVDPVEAGGGAVMDHTVHLVDLFRMLLDSDPVEVYAETTDRLRPDLAVESGGLVAVTFDNGVTATIDCSWSRPTTYPTWGGLTFEVIGERGVMVVDGFADRLTVTSERYGTRLVDFGVDLNRRMIDDTLDAVRMSRPPAATGLDGLWATRVALAAYRSAAGAAPVAVLDIAGAE